MLVLSRTEGEKIIIGDSIVVEVIAVTGKTVKLGVTAPKQIPVHREEVYEQINKKPVATTVNAKSIL